ncbi:MAG: hypothetical protein WA871_06215 [Candidatus Acidiferrales bacterium]
MMIAEGIKLLVNVRKRYPVLLALVLSFGLGTIPAAARQIDPSKPPPPPPSATPAPAPDAKPSSDSAAPAAATTPAFDPLHAQKSVDVGQYYLKTGNYPAAIDRFKEAIGYQSNLALPWDLLGQAYDKEHEQNEALAAYQKYLALLPDGKESDRVRKRVTKLQADLASDAAKQSKK